jgi:hypothetical protein
MAGRAVGHGSALLMASTSTPFGRISYSPGNDRDASPPASCETAVRTASRFTKRFSGGRNIEYHRLLLPA